jgi:hypothetical protein
MTQPHDDQAGAPRPIELMWVPPDQERNGLSLGLDGSIAICCGRTGLRVRLRADEARELAARLLVVAESLDEDRRWAESTTLPPGFA